MRYRTAPATVTIAAKTSPPAMTQTAKGFARIPELVLNPCSSATLSTLRMQRRERDSRSRSPRGPSHGRSVIAVQDFNVIVESNWPKSDTFKSGLHPSALLPQIRRSGICMQAEGEAMRDWYDTPTWKDVGEEQADVLPSRLLDVVKI